MLSPPTEPDSSCLETEVSDSEAASPSPGELGGFLSHKIHRVALVVNSQLSLMTPLQMSRDSGAIHNLWKYIGDFFLRGQMRAVDSP